MGISLNYQALKHISYSIGISNMNYYSSDGTKEGWGIGFEYMPKDNFLLNDTYGFKLEGYLATNHFGKTPFPVSLNRQHDIPN